MSNKITLPSNPCKVGFPALYINIGINHYCEECLILDNNNNDNTDCHVREVLQYMIFFVNKLISLLHTKIYNTNTIPIT